MLAGGRAEGASRRFRDMTVTHRKQHQQLFYCTTNINNNNNNSKVERHLGYVHPACDL